MTSDRLSPQQAKAGFILAIEKLQCLSDDVWDWSPSSKSPIAKLNSWLIENPNYRLVDTPRIESRLLSRQIENGVSVMTFSVSVSYLYADTSERVYDGRHTGVFESSSAQGRTKEERNDEVKKEEEKETKTTPAAGGSTDAAKQSAAKRATDTGNGPANSHWPSDNGTIAANAKAAGAASASGAATDAAASHSAERTATGNKFANAADAIDFLARSGISVPDTAARTIAGITARAAVGPGSKRVTELRPKQAD